MNFIGELKKSREGHGIPRNKPEMARSLADRLALAEATALSGEPPLQTRHKAPPSPHCASLDQDIPQTSLVRGEEMKEHQLLTINMPCSL
jgi:hypothetical protein